MIRYEYGPGLAPRRGVRAVLVLAVLAGLFGMHGLPTVVSLGGDSGDSGDAVHGAGYRPAAAAVMTAADTAASQGDLDEMTGDHTATGPDAGAGSSDGMGATGGMGLSAPCGDQALADEPCAAAAVPRPPPLADPDVTGTVPSQHDAGRYTGPPTHERSGRRAPPSLAELQLLRV